jgi:crotonobetainyl-CoA:carnitine CoA-transferase CaiB-like acyl-CoA transferase
MPARSGPLEGISVLDLSTNAPGPFCTMVLGDLGADVIAIHDPGPPSGRRTEAAAGAPAPPPVAGGETAWNALRRNKRSIGLNLKDSEARALFHRLAGSVDVVVEEMRPGVAGRLGADYETLERLNPRLVYCSITGYGQDGPYARLPGHDLNYIGQAGALGVIRAADGRPVIPHNLLADFAGGGLLAALGVLAALLARERTGRGQHVDAAMTDGVMYLMAQLLSEFYATGETPRGGRSTLSGGLPHYDAYKAADGRYVTIAALEPWFYAGLCRAIGREDLIPHAYDERSGELRSALAETIGLRTRDEWFAALSGSDQCVGRVLELDEVEHDPQVRARGMVLELAGKEGESVKQVGVAPKLSVTPGSVRSLAPRRGEHTDEILAGLGLTREEIERLRARGAVG